MPDCPGQAGTTMLWESLGCPRIRERALGPSLCVAVCGYDCRVSIKGGGLGKQGVLGERPRV